MRTLKTISEYNVLKKLGTGPWSEVFKVCRKDKPDRPLILKRIKLGRFGSRNPTNDIERQIKYLKQKSLPGTIIPDLHSHGETTLFLVQEYFKGIPLGYWRKTQTKNNLRDFFKIACAIAEILDKIHKAGHIHGGIKPNNILIMPDTLDIRLIDPVRVIKMDEIMYFIDNSDFMINTLAYLSPEQTGRIKKNLAYATDLYSIGAVFYELLNGKPPFLSTDPLEIIHSHLAEDPTPLNEIDSDIPGVVSDIIARLLRKETERRYQSGIGLLGDLVECRREYINRGKITSFSLGLRDSNVPLNIPSVMVGREREKELLLKEHTISTSGPFRAVIISGPPGIGKTRLIRELQEPIIEKGCYFTSGKPDQFHKNIPYRTLTQALRSLIRTILTEDKEKIAYWKDTITKGLGLNGRLITEFIPELELIIGIQPEVVDLPPIEARNRFINTTDRFISCMAGHDHPLTLFIDDLQWCDTTEYDAIENLFINTEDHPYLFFVGTYRQNEVVENHPLSNLLQRVRKTGNLLTELHLEKLDFFHINELTSHILNAPSSLTKSLSEIINVISGGNPLYIDESIIWLYENKLIRTNQEGLWQWDSDSIRNSMLPESAVTFFRDNLMKLPKDVVFLIQTAACLGVTFRSEDLAIITGMDIATLNQELSPAFSQKILLREKNFLAFFHDRIREAVYDTIDDKTKRRIHGRIGEMLLRSLPRGTDPMCADNLFDIVGHLNKGRDNITNRETLLRDMRLNYYAGMRSINSLAFEAASRYFKKSMEFLQENIWDTDYDFTYSLYKNLSKSELSQGNQDKSAIILETLIKKSRTEVDMAECIKERAAILLSLGEFQSSLDEGNKALSLLGVGIPRTDEDVQLKIKEYDDAIMKKPVSPDKILDRPGIYKREHLIELDIYNLQLTAYYIMLNIERFTLAAIQATYLCLTEGINEYSSFPISMYSAFLFEKGEYENAFIFENLANRLCSKFANTYGETSGLCGIAGLTSHLRHDIEYVLNVCKRGFESGKISGDIYHAGLSFCAYNWTAIFQGRDLHQIEASLLECGDYSRKKNLHSTKDYNLGLQIAWLEPMKGSTSDLSIETCLERWHKLGDRSNLFNYYIYAGMAQYYLGNFNKARDHLKKGEEHLIALSGTIPNRQFYIFFILNSLRLLGIDSSEDDINNMMARIQPYLEKIELWLRFGPVVKPYHAFIMAEIERVSGNFSETRRLYLDAIDIAHDQGYTLLEGHIQECMGELMFHRVHSQAGYHIKEAAKLYRECHAEQKFLILRNKYPKYFPEEGMKVPEGISLSKKINTEYIIKASMAISQELDLDELLKSIMKSLMECVGAQRGYLITQTGEQLFIRAVGIKEKIFKVFLKEELLSNKSGLSRAIVRYVYRTKEPVVIDNAMEEGPFVQDKEVKELKARSVLCHPIIKQQKLLGIIYLQNSLIKSAFNEEQIEFVRLLASQAAISLENAVIIEEMKKVEEELRKSEEKYRTLFETVGIPIFIVEEDTTFSLINTEFTNYFGYTKEQVQGKRFTEFVPKEDLERVMGYHRLRRIDPHAVPKTYESSFIDTRGNVRNSLISVALIPGTKQSIGSIMDITELKRAQTALQEFNIELEAKNRELEQIVYITSHDLRSPLINIQGFTMELESAVEKAMPVINGEDIPAELRERLKTIFEKDVQEAFQYITKSVSKMDSLLNGLLKLSRLGRMVFNNKRLDMNKLIANMVGAFEFKVKEKGIRLDIDDLPHCYGDEIQINQVFSNLMDNALKYLDPKRSGIIKISGARNERQTIYCIKDNGIGILKGHQKVIFELFHRLNPEASMGEGLGLTIVRRLIERHKGKIWVKSEINKGSKFYVSLPREGD